MLRILFYIGIILFGFALSKYNLIPEKIKSKIGIFQTFSLFFLLGIMGFNIGSDNKILSNFHNLGFQALVISIFSILGSILFTSLIFGKGGKK